MSSLGQSPTAAINDTNAIRPAGQCVVLSTRGGGNDVENLQSVQLCMWRQRRLVPTWLPSAILPWLLQGTVGVVLQGTVGVVPHDVASVAPIRQNTVYYAYYCHICELVFEQHPDTPLPRAMSGSSRYTRLCVEVFVMTTILALTIRRCVAKVPHLTVGCIGQVCFVPPLYIRAPYVCLSVPSVCYRPFDVQELCCATCYYFTVCAIPCFLVLVSTCVYIYCGGFYRILQNDCCCTHFCFIVTIQEDRDVL